MKKTSKWIYSLLLIPTSIFCGVIGIRSISNTTTTTQQTTTKKSSFVAIDINTIIEHPNMGTLKQLPTRNNILQYIYNDVAATYKDVVNDLDVGSIGQTSTIVITNSDSASYTGSVTITYTINNTKTNLSQIISPNSTIPTRISYDFWSQSEDVAKYGLIDQLTQQYSNLNGNQIKVTAIDYSSDNALRQFKGTATIAAKDSSTLYTGSTNFSFNMKVNLNAIFSDLTNLQYSPYDTLDAEKAAHLLNGVIGQNKSRINDPLTFETYITSSITTGSNTVVFQPNATGTNDYLLTNEVSGTFEPFKPTPPPVFKYVDDGNGGYIVDGFADANDTTIRNYDTLWIPDVYEGKTIKKINQQAFQRGSADTGTSKTGAAYDCLAPGGNLKYLRLPNGITTIEGNAFMHNRSFAGSTLFLPDSWNGSYDSQGLRGPFYDTGFSRIVLGAAYNFQSPSDSNHYRSSWYGSAVSYGTILDVSPNNHSYDVVRKYDSQGVLTGMQWVPINKYTSTTILGNAGWGTVDLADMLPNTVHTLPQHFFSYYSGNTSTIIRIPSYITSLATNSFYSCAQNIALKIKIEYENGGAGMSNLQNINGAFTPPRDQNRIFLVPNNLLSWYNTQYLQYISDRNWTFQGY